MIAMPTGRIAVPLITLIAAGGVAVAFGVQLIHRESPSHTGAGTAPVLAAMPPVKTREERPAVSEGGAPSFDIASIDPSGEAVIAGRAAPGATVEILGKGTVLGSVVADHAGEFVILPPELPSGTYKLTLRSKLPDGRQLTSKQSVQVALQPLPSQRASAALTPTSSPVSSQYAAPKPMAGGESNVVIPKVTTTAVARGDSLWRISRDTYGAGERYRLIFGANRKHISDPNLIYPGQVLVLPAKKQHDGHARELSVGRLVR